MMLINVSHAGHPEGLAMRIDSRVSKVLYPNAENLPYTLSAS